MWSAKRYCPAANADCPSMVIQCVSHSSLQEDVEEGESTQPRLIPSVVLNQSHRLRGWPYHRGSVSF